MLALYLQRLEQTKGSKATAEEVVNAISWAHSMAGLASPTVDVFVHSVLSKPATKKAPVTAEMIKSIAVDALNNKSPWLVSDWQLCA